ncbi:hypothetical protein ALC53_08959 [Atta colombica]|uniref:Uncharacterized protein n=1 Tax=Atta colombica TaxID=520822 RepID=A0A151I1R1_9HYME|nr:hypothetical protein ALC53_08959 [Atta colombica]
MRQGETQSGLQEEDRRGRIGASEAEASLLGDYGSLIPIQRSELHAERKSRPPESRGVSCGERLKPPAPPSPLGLKPREENSEIRESSCWRNITREERHGNVATRNVNHIIRGVKSEKNVSTDNECNQALIESMTLHSSELSFVDFSRTHFVLNPSSSNSTISRAPPIITGIEHEFYEDNCYSCRFYKVFGRRCLLDPRSSEELNTLLTLCTGRGGKKQENQHDEGIIVNVTHVEAARHMDRIDRKEDECEEIGSRS